MAIFILISVVIAVISATSSTQPSCPEGGCSNVTIYLGPRWGSKVIQNWGYSKRRGQNVPEGTAGPEVYVTKNLRSNVNSMVFVPTGGIRKIGYTQRPSTANDIHGMPRYRPVNEDNRIITDYKYDEDFRVHQSTRSYPRRTMQVTTNNPTTSSDLELENIAVTVNVNALFDTGILNISGVGITGDQVKKCLWQLSHELSGGSNMPLKYLHLSHNQIQELPLLVFPVDLEYWLLELRLDNNPLTYLTSYTRFELSRLGHLKILSLARTGLRYLETLYIPSLEVLDLSDNHLSSVPTSLESFHNLQQLYLDGNRILTLFSTPFTSMHELRVLSLSGNYISHIWETPFLFLSYLYKLDLHNNSLESLEQLNLNSLTTVTLGGNPLRCSCELLDTISHTWPDIVDKDDLTCQDGDYNGARLLRYITKDDIHEECSRKWKWLLDRGEQLEDIARWFRSRGIHVSKVFSFLAWLLLIIVIVVIVRRLHAAKRKVVPLEVPYNILDDKRVIQP